MRSISPDRDAAAKGSRVVSLGPDGRRIAAARGDSQILLLDADSGTILHALKEHIGAILALRFSPDGRWLASSSEDQTLRLWDVSSGAEVAAIPAAPDVLPDRGHAGPVQALAFSPDARLLVSAAAVKLWEAATGKELRSLAADMFAFSSDGRLLAGATAKDAGIRLWDAATGREAGALAGHVDPVRFLGGAASVPLLASAAFGLVPAQAPAGSPAPVRQEIKLWDLASRRELPALPRPARSDFPNLLPRPAYRGEISALAISRDGRLLASADEGLIALWDTHSGEQLRVLAGYQGRISALAFSPDGRLLASCAGDEYIRLWDPNTGREQRILAADPERVLAIAFSPDGRILASGGSERSAKLWDVATGQLLRSLPEQ